MQKTADIETIPVPTATNRYLWNYEIITYKGDSNDNPNETSGPACISVHGESPYAISLDNDSDVIVISSASGNVLGGYPTITAKTFYGGTEVSTGNVAISSIGCDINSSGRSATITATNAASGSITFSWRPNGANTEPIVSKTFTFTKTTSNADYDLIIPQTTFNKKSDVTVNVSILRKKDGAASDVIAPGDDNDIVVQY
jgi:hypothetical protein